MVHLEQTMHLFFVKISTISELTETSFHLSLLTYEYHRMRPKQILSLWYVWRKPCSYLAPTLANTISNWPERRFHITHIA
jgi:hypothetical protein